MVNSFSDDFTTVIYALIKELAYHGGLMFN